jgi:hypothetical protein
MHSLREFHKMKFKWWGYFGSPSGFKRFTYESTKRVLLVFDRERLQKTVEFVSQIPRSQSTSYLSAGVTSSYRQLGLLSRFLSSVMRVLLVL